MMRHLLRHVIAARPREMRSGRPSGGACALVTGGLLALLLGGCVAPPITQSVGVHNGYPVATVTVMSREDVPESCFGGELTLACARTWPIGDGVLGVSMIFPFPSWTPTIREVYVAAHELCHVVAALQRLPDMCHDQDGGIVP